ncbi:hypothetical protein Moror_488 [Moniliophthora roreri MCA 2997]|uniref:Zn(2)-C6 fungal-type domain-containing protein n=1 Tax=Moniliophthora roreri (strain MCA 2997) TaxID=1381753 RepID=V2XWA1_MONRO|nr:hypothetical protein Moror_488 [Moniliophthora roreri MCA 2997]
MNSAQQGSSNVKKQEDSGDDKNGKGDAKPTVVVNRTQRVPRACNACRKQKMRCEGAENPPCRRCRNTGLECLFEKPSREATLTGEAGLERIRSLEAHVMDIRNTQASILNALTEISASLRGAPIQHRSPSTYPPFHQSPNLHSPSVSTPPTVHPHPGDMQPSPIGPPNVYGHGDPSMSQQSRMSQRPSMGSHTMSNLSQSSQISPVDYQSSQTTPVPANSYPPFNNGHGPSQPPASQGAVLPPFSSLQTMGSSSGQHQQGNVSSVRSQIQNNPSRSGRPNTSQKRAAPGSSNVTSAASSDIEDDDSGELPASGLVAPWEVLRGLADVASERAAKENGENGEPYSRHRTPTPERQTRPAKRRKLRHRAPRSLMFPDVVTKNVITESEARELFRIFYHGCSTFLPVFDSANDAYEALHERSPFAVNCICMVAARVRDGGGKPSDIYKKCLEEVQSISCATLFLPVTRVEAVQAMILVSGWSDNGWLSGGHAVRMAMELSLHKAWPRLLRRMRSGKTSQGDDHDLVIAARTWFCLYLFEHQMSYGTGRPAVLKEDESIANCRLLLQHPLAIEDDMRLVSTVELIMIRERVHNALAPFDEPVKDSDFEELKAADTHFRNWYATWDQCFSQKYEDVAFYRQSLQIQQLHAELFHNATALRGINGPEDVERMPQVQKELAIRSIQIARQGLDITVNSPAYREGMKYAVHYTHVAATFAASFLLRLSRLFPDQCDIYETKAQVERLAMLMAELPGRRYALTLEVMLKRFQKRSNSHSPKTGRSEAHRPPAHRIESSGNTVRQNSGHVPFSPVYETFPQGGPQGHHMPSHHGGSMPPHHPHPHPHPQQQQHHQPGSGHHYPVEADNIWSGFETTANEQLPVWISDQTLGGNSFSQNGMDAFLLPQEYLPPAPAAPQIW